jgi:hypothetical protein
VSFIDDFSKFTWIYLLKHKSEVFQKFQEFHNLVECFFDKKILAVQTDWGGEYQKLNAFFQRVGISHHVSYPYAHQQNGSAERKHHHIVEVGLSLLAHSCMPLKYWDEAFLAATYLINRIPTKVLDFSSPLELLFKEKPNYGGLRTFGCTCWPNLRPFNTHKLQFRSKQCICLGYSNLHKGFKCLDVAEEWVYISRDVVFDETVYPFSKRNPNAGSRLRSDVLLPLDSQPCFSGDEFLDDSITNVHTNPVATNPLCCNAASEKKNLAQNSEDLVSVSPLHGETNLGAEYGDDLETDLAARAVLDLSAASLPRTRMSEPGAGRHVAPGFDEDSPARVLWSQSAQDSSTGRHVGPADSSPGCHVALASDTLGLSTKSGSAAVQDPLVPALIEFVSVLGATESSGISSDVIPARHGTHLQHGIYKPNV